VASMTRHCALPEAIVGTLVVGFRADMAARWLPEPGYKGRESSVAANVGDMPSTLAALG
jgi:hypothetical protein